MNIAFYIRVSTKEQDFEMQKNAFEKWKVKNDITADVTVYQDHGISGSKRDRPGFNEMLEACMDRKHDTIVVYKLDRFSRDANTALLLILEMEKYGIAFISITQAALNLGHDVPFRRTLLAAFSEIAQIERETIVARIKDGMEAARAKGKVFGRPKIISPKKAVKAKQLRDRGFSYNAISKKMKMSVGSVHKMIND